MKNLKKLFKSMSMVRRNYWMVVWDKKTGFFLNARGKGFNEKQVQKKFMKSNPHLKVIHIGKGTESPKTYRSLPFA
ncbi:MULTISPECIES: hypothetical protein [Metabacillus]|uniref:hypothetical protein n=1 Tax=Metabacillus TaxID=2675233 RepID=UPI000C80F64C|nr:MULTISPECIES: hypothetical protein [Metabacillus]MCM3443583.1 hypothetical protein [Metabacillus halosaccharovorans]PMC34256.1 hypothetical protein CJ195_24375 [Bacillus sp. UMB0899]